MCGIFGLIAHRASGLDSRLYKKTVQELFLLSESRGKEASGFATIMDSDIFVHKTPFPAQKLVRSRHFDAIFDHYLEHNQNSFATIGHSRLVTNGYEHFNNNNQPVNKNSIVGIHNGIVVNVKQLWEKYRDEKKESDLDTEIIFTLLGKFLANGASFKMALRKVYEEIYGMTTIALFFQNYDNLVLATNNGSLYYVKDFQNKSFVFASEFHILAELIRKNTNPLEYSAGNIRQLQPNSGLILNYENLTATLLDLNDISQNGEAKFIHKRAESLKIRELNGVQPGKKIFINTSLEHKAFTVPEEFEAAYKKRAEKVTKLRRCTHCLLPETFPFIEYDEAGVCNFCRNYQKIDYRGLVQFEQLVQPFREGNGKPECLMPFSGGRDSSYALHVVKAEMGLKPIAYSYDWGMLTDLARRNQARMCGKLGVEHILISADIRRKRANIRKNVLAWLKRPNLGTIPLFMAGDKQYFFYANLLMQQNNLQLSILGENMLETTNFKSGFCGIKPQFEKGHTYSLSIKNKLKMFGFYGREFLLNPAYINSSLLDTFDAFRSYYMIQHRNVNIYNYIKWDEDVINSTLIDEYDWETDPGTKTTWRIGDGTAAFYNYIYYMVAGFSENDTFRSNQIREGDLSREEALRKANAENQPRWDSMKWYCDTIGIDFEKAINKINKIKILY